MMFWKVKRHHSVHQTTCTCNGGVLVLQATAEAVHASQLAASLEVCIQVVPFSARGVLSDRHTSAAETLGCSRKKAC